MKKRIVLVTLLVVTVLVVYASTKAQKLGIGLPVLRIQQVTEQGVIIRSLGQPEVMGFSCAAAVADTEPTCYVLLRDR